MRTVYPEIAPYNEFFLKVSDLHTLHVEEVGNPQGQPVVFLHGGPGGGTDPYYRRFFDPRKWRVVLFSQRGCGKSTPFAELRENTTWDLVADMEKIRNHLHIDRWAIFGGSWGSTLALAYAEEYPERVKSLMLRGIFLVRDQEIDWFYQSGAHRIFTDAWQKFLEPIAPAARSHMVKAYYQLLTSPDRSTRLRAAKAWSLWEATTIALLPDQGALAKFSVDDVAEAFARIECHYFINHGFLKPNQLLENATRLAGIPGVIVQGRYDVVCPFESAWELSKAWPKGILETVADAGHSVREPGITSKLIEYSDKFADL